MSAPYRGEKKKLEESKEKLGERKNWRKGKMGEKTSD